MKKRRFVLNKKTVANVDAISGGRGFGSNDCTMRCTLDPPCTDSNTPECQITVAPGCPDPTTLQTAD